MRVGLKEHISHWIQYYGVSLTKTGFAKALYDIISLGQYSHRYLSIIPSTTYGTLYNGMNRNEF